MCGIAGFSLSPNERPINANRLARHLLLGIEHRGRDATGAAWRTDNNLGVVVQKKDKTASEWVKSLSMPRYAQVGILHTRAWTQGPPKDQGNNHPITVGPITGVHNGVIWNDREIFQELGEYGIGRQAQVDSEAIFALLAHGGSLWDYKHDTDLLERVQGAAAIAYFDTTGPDNELHLARLCGSPLVIAQTPAGSLIFASTVDAIEEAMSKMHLTIGFMDEKVDEGAYFRIRDGIIHEKTMFMPDWSYYSKRQWLPSAKPGPAPVKAIKEDTHDGHWCVLHDEYDWYCDCTAKVVSQYKPIDPQPTGWLAQGIVETRNLFTTHDVGPMDDEDFLRLYDKRLGDIERFANNLEAQPKATAESVLKALNANHWQTRPGDWVMTTLGTEEYNAQVLEVPESFPGGDYLVRIFINATIERGSEYLLARRKGHEFRDLKTRDTANDKPSTALVAVAG